MLFRIQDNLRRNHAIQLAGLQLSLATGLCVAFAFASTGALPADAHPREPPPALASLRSGPAPTPAAVPSDQDAAAVIRLQDLSPEAARLWNASIPLSTAPNPAARPFRLATEGQLDETRATDCMTAAIYYEAGYESLDGQRAVAQVVLNRLRNPLFPKSVCGVVFQGAERATGCQFTFTCDGALKRRPAEDAWDRARKVAVAALDGYVMKKVGNATHYHADYVAPAWSPTLVKVAVVGQHIFYRWTGGLGLPPAFGGRYAGGEMKDLQIATLDNLAPDARGLAMSPAPEATAAKAPPPADVVEASPVKPADVVAASATDRMADASAAVVPAGPLRGPPDLDWLGRPKKDPPKEIRPGASPDSY